jgi:carboxymethylenebutenolidase
MGEALTFNRPDGSGCPGFYVAPEREDGCPGVVVIQEWWGLNDDIRTVAGRFAANGYRALVPDLYRGRVTLEDAEASHLMGALDFLDAATQDIRGAVRRLAENDRPVGIAGFCLGGALAIMSAVHVPEVSAVSCWYGVPPPEAGDTRSIRVPLQGHFALRDKYFPPLMVQSLESSLREGGVEYEFHQYDADHAFAHVGAPYYNHDAAELAWARTLDFFARRL